MHTCKGKNRVWPKRQVGDQVIEAEVGSCQEGQSRSVQVEASALAPKDHLQHNLILVKAKVQD